ncbi:MAG: DUF2911 domain-containing protein [Gemmatimonas sp.]
MRATLLTLVLVATATALPCQAQMYPFSQRGKISQTVAFTEITIEYGRPTARGRVLFGALVPWDSVWHPGADNATQIAFSRDVVLEGQAVKAGTYTTWLIPRASRPWTFILSRAVGVSHTPYPGRAQDALRIDVAADSASHLETLTYHFPVVLREDATLRLQWGATGISLRIKAAARASA